MLQVPQRVPLLGGGGDGAALDPEGEGHGLVGGVDTEQEPVPDRYRVVGARVEQRGLGGLDTSRGRRRDGGKTEGTGAMGVSAEGLGG